MCVRAWKSLKKKKEKTQTNLLLQWITALELKGQERHPQSITVLHALTAAGWSLRRRKLLSVKKTPKGEALYHKKPCRL